MTSHYLHSPQYQCSSMPPSKPLSPYQNFPNDSPSKVDALFNEVQELKVALAALASTNPAEITKPVLEDSTKPVPEESNESQPEAETDPDLNASVASVEELITEPMNISAESLNCEDPTSYLP